MEDLSVGGIIEEAEERLSEDDTTKRLGSYKRGTAAYFNEYGDEAGFRAMYRDGRPALDTNADQMRDSLAYRAQSGSLIKSFVNDFVSIKGNLPLMTVDPEGAEDGDFQTANDRTRFLQWVWDNSRMITQFKRAAFYLSALGDAPITMDFLMPPAGNVKKDDARFEGGLKPPGIYLTVSHPGLALPLFRTGVDMGELEDLILYEDLPARRARAKWPTAVRADLSDTEIVKVYHVYTRTCRITIVDHTEVSRFEHNLGFVPAQWIKNSENGRMAQSDIEGIIDAHIEYQIMRAVTNDALIQAVYPLTVVQDVQAFPDRIPTGPGAVVPVGPTGKVYQIQPGANANAGAELTAGMLSSIEQMVGSAPVRTESSINQSNISSRAVHAVQGPMEGRLASQQDIIGQHIVSLNSKIMLAYYKIKELNKNPIDVPTKGADGPKKLSFSGESFGGWWRNTVDWDAFAGSTRHERVVVALQLQGAEVVGKGFVAEQAGIRNADQEIKRAEAEVAAKVAQQQAAAAPPAAPEGGAMPGAVTGPSDQALGLGAGGTSAGPTQPAPMGGPPVGGPGPGPDFPPVQTPPTQQGAGFAPVVEPISVEVQRIADFNQIPLAGDAYELQGSIIVIISNWKDSGRIKKLLHPIAHGKKIVVQVDPKGEVL